MALLPANKIRVAIHDRMVSCKLENPRMPAFLTKKQVLDWINTGEKTIELRRGRTQDGDNIAFLNGKGQCVKGRILRRREGKLEDVLNVATYRKIIPTAKSLDDAVEFIRQLYQSTEGTFTAYEFKLNQE